MCVSSTLNSRTMWAPTTLPQRMAAHRSSVRNASTACTFSHVICRITLEDRYGPTNLHGVRNAACKKWQHSWDPQHIVFDRLGRSSTLLPKKSVKKCRMGRREKLGWDKVEGGIRLTDHRRTQCRPSLVLPAPWENIFPKVTLYLPILSQLPGRILERWIGWQGISGPGSYLTHFIRGVGVLLSQGTVSSPHQLPPSAPMILRRTRSNQLHHTDS